MYQPQKEHFTLLCVCGCYLVIGRCCADNWSAPGVWLRCHRAVVTMETWSVAGERDVTLVMGSPLTRRTGTTLPLPLAAMLPDTIPLHITSVKPDLTQIVRLVQFHRCLS